LPGTNADEGWKILSSAYNADKKLLDAFTKIAMNDLNFNDCIRDLVYSLDSLSWKFKNTLLEML